MVRGAGTTQQVNRARAAAEEDAAGKADAEAVEAAERLQMEEQLASIALRMQQVHAQLGNSVVPPSAPAPDKEETVCVVCMDAPNQYATVPCNCAFARGVRNHRLLELAARVPFARRAPVAAVRVGVGWHSRDCY
jgi:hypothetical protein